MIADVKIGEKWLLKDFDFVFSEKNISPPEPKLTIIEVPGTSDVIDLTESITGDVEYKQRKITLKLESAHGKDSYYSDFSKLSNYMHGKKMKIIFNKDSGYYWIGRIKVTGSDSKFYGSTITVEATVDPYKYEINQQYPVALTLPQTVTLVGLHKHICPVFLCSNEMTVEYLGNTYSLNTGENQILEIFLGPGTHELNFSGTGTVTIDYRGASL